MSLNNVIFVQILLFFSLFLLIKKTAQNEINKEIAEKRNKQNAKKALNDDDSDDWKL